MKQFVDDTHLHGVKELYHAPTLFKVLWLLVILGSIGFCAYETFKVLQEYVEAKPITQISVQAPLKFPPVLFCPPDWLNESAIEELGISESVLMYGLGYLWEFSNAIKKEHPLFKAVLGNLTAIQSEFNALLNSTFNNEIDVSVTFSIEPKNQHTYQMKIKFSNNINDNKRAPPIIF